MIFKGCRTGLRAALVLACLAAAALGDNKPTPAQPAGLAQMISIPTLDIVLASVGLDPTEAAKKMPVAHSLAANGDWLFVWPVTEVSDPTPPWKRPPGARLHLQFRQSRLSAFSLDLDQELGITAAMVMQACGAGRFDHQVPKFGLPDDSTVRAEMALPVWKRGTNTDGILVLAVRPVGTGVAGKLVITVCYDKPPWTISYSTEGIIVTPDYGDWKGATVRAASFDREPSRLPTPGFETDYD